MNRSADDTPQFSKLDEAKHFVSHYFGVAIFKVAMYWALLSDRVRAVWWKCWGFNPKKDPNFHLSKMAFDKGTVRRMLVTGAPYNLALAFYGSEAAALNCKSVLLMSMYVNYRFIPLATWVSVADLFKHDKPGQNIVDWFCKTEGISERGYNHKLKQSPVFSDAVQKTLDLEFS